MPFHVKAKNRYTDVNPDKYPLKSLPCKSFSTKWNSPSYLGYSFLLRNVLLAKCWYLILFTFKKSLPSSVSFFSEFNETLIFLHFLMSCNFHFSLLYSMVKWTVCNSISVPAFANMATFSWQAVNSCFSSIFPNLIVMTSFSANTGFIITATIS